MSDAPNDKSFYDFSHGDLKRKDIPTTTRTLIDNKAVPAIVDHQVADCKPTIGLNVWDVPKYAPILDEKCPPRGTKEYFDYHMQTSIGLPQALPATPLTLEDAVKVLNDKRHNYDHANIEDHHTIEWVIESDSIDCKPYALLVRYITEYKKQPWSRDENGYHSLTEFEAVAIAKAYLRQGK